ncbi:MAG TPA: JAB domain-containing protein [Pedobacter sp.]|jgi:DNA repair protein RadC
MNSNEQPLALVAEIQLNYHPKVKPSQRPTVTTSREVYQLFFNSWDSDRMELQEQFKIMLLNRSSKVLGIVEVSSGGIGGTLADPKLIFVAALKAGASSIILAHNHPSGQLTPSQADRNLTKKLTDGGKLLDISVFDHLILTAESYFSFADEGII